MSDSFSFGEPARRPPRLERPEPRRPKPEPALGRSRSSILVAAVAAGIAVLIGFVVLSVIHGGGTSAAEAERTAVSQIDRAQDVQAQLALEQASAAARTLQAESASGFDRAGAGALASYDPALGAIAGASTGPTSVSVAASTTGWGAAAMSASGACYWIHLDTVGTVAYGMGTPCTGQAAMAATGSAW